MISSEVQRTLVKSPPELWAELSDPAALARHLGELGEIRIVRAEPESTVEWAAENTTGTVSIKPSGWGTKVTLSVTRQTPEEAPTQEAPSEAEAAPEPVAPPDAEATAPEPAAIAGTTSEPEPSRGFFARLFARRRREATPPPSVEQPPGMAPADPMGQEQSAASTPDAPDAFAAVRQVLAPETFAAEHPHAAASEVKTPTAERSASEPKPTATSPASTVSEPQAGTDRDQDGGISAELLAAEEAGAEEVTAVLTAALDRLGAAHHRPFSRS